MEAPSISPGAWFVAPAAHIELFGRCTRQSCFSFVRWTTWPFNYFSISPSLRYTAGCPRNVCELFTLPYCLPQITEISNQDRWPSSPSWASFPLTSPKNIQKSLSWSQSSRCAEKWTTKKKMSTCFHYEAKEEVKQHKFCLLWKHPKKCFRKKQKSSFRVQERKKEKILRSI